MAHGAGWEGHIAVGPESSFGLGAGAACSLDLPQPEAELQLCKETALGKAQLSTRCLQEGTARGCPALGRLPPLLLSRGTRGVGRSCSPPRRSLLSAGTWTLAELSEVLKVPVTSLKRKMTLWLQQGVLREEPPGTFTVIEEEQKDQGEKVVLIDSDEEGDSAMASQADQKEEELQVCVGACRAGGTAQTSNAFGFLGWIRSALWIRVLSFQLEGVWTESIIHITIGNMGY